MSGTQYSQGGFYVLEEVVSKFGCWDAFFVNGILHLYDRNDRS